MSAQDRIVAHVISTLPDSIQARKAILADLIEIMDRKHPDFKQLQMMLILLEIHEQHQLDLPGLLNRP